MFVGALVTSANAADISPYVSAKVGYGSSNFDSEHTDTYTGPGFMIAGGARLATEYVNLRGELEVSRLSYEGSGITEDHYPSYIRAR